MPFLRKNRNESPPETAIANIPSLMSVPAIRSFPDIAAEYSGRTREALHALAPPAEKIDAEIPLVSSLSGRRPKLEELLKVTAARMLHLSIVTGRPEIFEEWDPVLWLLKHAPSVSAERAQHIVDTARMTTSTITRRGWFGR